MWCTSPDATADEESIVAHCGAHLAAYMVPRQVQLVEDVPKISTGKITRRELKTLDSLGARLQYSKVNFVMLSLH